MPHKHYHDNKVFAWIIVAACVVSTSAMILLLTIAKWDNYKRRLNHIPYQSRYLRSNYDDMKRGKMLR